MARFWNNFHQVRLPHNQQIGEQTIVLSLYEQVHQWTQTVI